MKRVLTLTLSLLVALALPLAADPWTLGGECNSADQPTYDRFAQAVRTALPGSTVYVPKPYPTTDRQVIQDLLYQYKSLHRERADPKKLPPGELALLNGILDSTVTFRVQRIENWTPGRCGREQRSDFFHLIGVFDAASGAEISRVTLEPSGLFSAKTNYPRGVPYLPLPDPAVAMRAVTASYEVQGDSPQYVVSLGSILCGFTAPCLAFRQGSDAYIFFKHSFLGSALFKIAGDEPRLDLRPGDVQSGRHPPLSTDGRERLFYLGGTTWTIAREVSKPVAAGGH